MGRRAAVRVPAQRLEEGTHLPKVGVRPLSPSIKVQMQVEMNTMESKALATGKNLRVDDPIALW